MPDGSILSAALRPTGCDATPGLMPPAEALALILAGAVPVPEGEALPLAALPGRVLAAPAASALALPPFAQSAMDGYAFHADDLHPGATPRLVRAVAAGDAPGPPLRPGEAVRILTGAALPDGTAAVVMQEHAALRDGRVEARRIPRPGDNIRRRGEDVAAGQVLLPPGTRLDARHVALLAAAGLGGAVVRRRVRVAVLSNGNELREAGCGEGGAGAAVNDSNRPMLLALLAARPELEVTDLGLVGDDAAALAGCLATAAAGQDVILASGGVCGSDADHLPGAILRAGGTVRTLKLRQKPGKPLALGRIGRALCLCLPGNPQAALVAMLTLGCPLLARLAGMPEAAPAGQPAVAAEGFTRHPGREEFLPARILRHDAAGRPVVARSGHAGSARLLPLALADGFLWLPAEQPAVAAGEPVRFWPFATAFGLSG